MSMKTIETKVLVLRDWRKRKHTIFVGLRIIVVLTQTSEFRPSSFEQAAYGLKYAKIDMYTEFLFTDLTYSHLSTTLSNLIVYELQGVNPYMVTLTKIVADPIF